jgi:hypothetical protein
MRQLTLLSVAMGTVAALALGVSACGGGGGGGISSTSSSSSSTATGTSANVATAVVNGGPTGVTAVNTLYVTVTICVPGSTTNCQTIPDIQVDTGSYGLRIIGTVLNASLYNALPAEKSGANPIAECAQWADGYSWGPMFTADMQIAGQGAGAMETASSIPVQVIGATDYTTVPADCTNTGPNGEEDTVAKFGANGIIGIGPFVPDCGPGCASGAGIQATYYTCASPSTCTDSAGGGNFVTVPVSEQASNPVAFFATDNNGVIIELPSVPAGGSATVTGQLIFGIGTETNNALGSATVFNASPDYGTITTTFNGTALNGSYFDTGSNGLFFNDSSINQCTSPADFYCPESGGNPTTLSLSATVESCTSSNSNSLGCTGSSSTMQTVNFMVGNASDGTQFPMGNTAFNDLAGTLPPMTNSPFTGVFDWGLPFFYGQNIFVAIACSNDSGVSNCATGAPFFAIAAQ